MKRPLVIVMICVCLGILTGYYFSAGFWLALVGVCVCAGVLYGLDRSKVVILFVLFFVWGYVSVHQQLAVTNERLEALAMAQTEVTLTGVVRSVGKSTTGRQMVQVALSEEKGRIQAILSEEDDVVKLGQTLTMTGRLLPPEPATIPGGFDQVLYLKTQGIDYTMFPNQLVLGEIIPSFVVAVDKIRQQMLAVFDEALPEKEANTLKAMILGERGNLDETLVEAYRVAGFYHLMVVSGTHLTILMVFLDGLFTKFFSRKMSSLLTLGVIVLFGVMVGGVSVTRAILMASLLIGAKLVWRRYDMLTALAGAGILLLLTQPLYLFNAGFLLSFCAVLGIAVGTEPIRWLVHVVSRGTFLAHHYLLGNEMIAQGVSASVATFLFILPVVAFYFYTVQIYGVFANVVVMLVSQLLITLGILMPILGQVHQVFGYFLGGSVFVLLSGLEHVAMFFYRLPFSQIVIGRPPLVGVVSYYAMLLVGLYLVQTKQTKGIKYWCASAVGVAGVFFVMNRIPSQQMHVAFLDLGSHQTTVITAQHKTYLVHGGGNAREQGENIGAKQIVPYLQYKGIRQVEAIFLTEANEQTGVSTAEIGAGVHVKQVYVPQEITADVEWMQLVQGETILATLEVNEVVSIGKSEMRSVGDNGQVAYHLRYNDVSILFGQAETEPIEAQVMVLRHEQKAPAFELRNQPILAVISGGQHWFFGHEVRGMLDAVEKMQIPYYPTDVYGTIELTIDKSIKVNK